MLIIFDIDGTLCDTMESDTRFFLESLRTIADIELGDVDWNDFPDTTDSAIISHLLQGRPHDEITAIERAIRDHFVESLRAEADARPDVIRPLPGAVEFFSMILTRPGWDLAIATGGWSESARLKLRLAGFPENGFAFASSADRDKRAEIIALAAERARRSLTEAVYLGDALWDYRATCKLGIPFVGIGAGWAGLRQAGAAAAFPDFAEPHAILDFLQNLKPNQP
ncbi:MAG: HAD hydrolase-like protein [Opitutaceae bacterium]